MFDADRAIVTVSLIVTWIGNSSLFVVRGVGKRGGRRGRDEISSKSGVYQGAHRKSEAERGIVILV